MRKNLLMKAHAQRARTLCYGNRQNKAGRRIACDKRRRAQDYPMVQVMNAHGRQRTEEDQTAIKTMAPECSNHARAWQASALLPTHGAHCERRPPPS